MAIYYDGTMSYKLVNNYTILIKKIKLIVTNISVWKFNEIIHHLSNHDYYKLLLHINLANNLIINIVPNY